MTKLSEWRSTWPDEAPDIYIGVDPGVTTGIAIWNRYKPDLIELHELTLEYVTSPLLKYDMQDAHFFTERFDIGNETVRVNPPVDSLYINGWMAIYAGPSHYTEIGRADAKSVASNARLQHYGWWERGSGQHCRDAARVLAFAMGHYGELWLLDKMLSYVKGLADAD